MVQQFAKTVSNSIRLDWIHTHTLAHSLEMEMDEKINIKVRNFISFLSGPSSIHLNRPTYTTLHKRKNSNQLIKFFSLLWNRTKGETMGGEKIHWKWITTCVDLPLSLLLAEQKIWNENCFHLALSVWLVQSIIFATTMMMMMMTMTIWLFLISYACGHWAK